jgi:putative peptidoglycan lipid II flippase
MNLKSALSFAFGTLISRVLGFLREMVFAYSLGSTQYADAVVVAIRIPTMLRGILAEGISQNAFVPIFVRWKDKGLLWSLIYIIIGATSMAVILGMLFSPFILNVIAPGFSKDPEKYSFTLVSMLFTFPSLLFISASALQMGIANSRGKFFISGFSPVFFNIGMIITLFFASKYPILGALSFLVGCVMQFLFLLPFTFEFPQKPNFRHPAIPEFFKNWLSISLNSGFLQISTFINTVISSFLPTGSIAYLNYAFRLIQLPQGLIGVSFGTVLSKESSEEEGRALQKLKKSIIFSTIFSLFFVILFGIFGEMIIRLLFVRGKFTPLDAENTYLAVLGYLPSLPAFVYSSIFLSYLFALFKRRLANEGFVLSTITNFFLAPILSFFFGYIGLAFAVSLSQIAPVLYWSYRVFGKGKYFLFVVSQLAFTLILSLAMFFSPS